MKLTLRHPNIRKYSPYCYRKAVYEELIDPYDVYADFRPLSLLSDFPRDLRGVRDNKCTVVDEIEIRWKCEDYDFSHDFWSLYVCANVYNGQRKDMLVASGILSHAIPTKDVQEEMIERAFR